MRKRYVPTLTPSQKTALVAWWLAKGHGLSERDIKKLRGDDNAQRSLEQLARVAELARDENGIWSWVGGSLTAQRHASGDRRKDGLSCERAAWVAMLLATQGEVEQASLMQQLGITRQAVTFMLDHLAMILPIYSDEADPRRWLVLDMREEMV